MQSNKVFLVFLLLSCVKQACSSSHHNSPLLILADTACQLLVLKPHPNEKYAKDIPLRDRTDDSKNYDARPDWIIQKEEHKKRTRKKPSP